ncbi:MAG TPA: RNA polymerase sigma factor [Tepidisphaeraceae bacterium]|jgi:RNA polymerase sigma factor (sigma-70 family)
MTTTLLPISKSDTELVTASRNGNREAFGQIVRRYQGMISGLIYAACGDLHRSEDIAQETFISAWKSLSGLRDASKLPSWLCQIARHRIADHFREPATQKMQLQEQLAETIPAEVTDEKMSVDETEMLWRTLSRIPQPYRETMVLYYRQGQSTAEVAAAMETTDAGVRQRLTRGRQMLREELAVLVERNLAHSAPGAEFSLAVVAALPLAAAPTAVVTATTAKGSAAAKSGGLMFIMSNWLAPLLGLMTMGLITFESLRRAESRAAKKSLAAYWLVFWGVIIAWIFTCVRISVFGQSHAWDYATYINTFSIVGGIFCMTLFGLLAWSSTRQRQYPQPSQTPKMFRSAWPRFFFLVPLIYCGLGWLMNLAFHANDYLTAGCIVASVIVGALACTLRNSSEALEHNPLKMAFESWLLMVSVTLVVLNLRLRPWVASMNHLTIADVQQHVPLWSINVAGAIVLTWMIFLRMQQKKLIAN